MMLTPLEQLETQINGVDRSLAYHMVIQLTETNKLLRMLIENKQDTPEPILKRVDIMKRMNETNPPKGWQKWSNEKMLEHLKEVS